MLLDNICVSEQFNGMLVYHNMRKVDHPVYLENLVEIARLGHTQSYRLKDKDGVYYFLMRGGRNGN